MNAQIACPECKVIGGDHKAGCTRPALLADLAQAQLAERAAKDCNRTWEDVSDDFVFANGAGEPSRIPPESLQEYLQRFPQFHDRLVELYQDWNREPLVTDEMLEAIEHSDATPAEESNHWMRAQRIIRFYRKLRNVEGERDRLVEALRAWKSAEHYGQTYSSLPDARVEVADAWQHATDLRDTLLEKYPTQMTSGPAADLTDEQRTLISRPIVQSLLYDINLLPEQLLALQQGPGHPRWDYMLAVLGHFDMAFQERDGLVKALTEAKDFTQHSDVCALNAPGQTSCDCDLDEFVARVDALIASESPKAST